VDDDYLKCPYELNGEPFKMVFGIMMVSDGLVNHFRLYDEPLFDDPVKMGLDEPSLADGCNGCEWMV